MSRLSSRNVFYIIKYNSDCNLLNINQKEKYSDFIFSFLILPIVLEYVI